MAKLVNWKPDEWKGKAVKYKSYESYDQYLEHQKHGMKHKGESVIFGRFNRDVERFKGNFKELDWLLKDKKKAICLGARSGAEVKALRDLGIDAIGIDVEPGTNNKYVEYGDFHDIQYNDKLFNIIYTNVLDHVYDLPRCLDEIKRIMTDDGVFILEVVAGYEEDGWPGDHESAYWAKAEDLITEVEQYGFKRKTKIQKVPYCKGLPFRRVLLEKRWTQSDSSSGTTSGSL